MWTAFKGTWADIFDVAGIGIAAALGTGMIGLLIGLVAVTIDNASDPYVDGTEANELLDAGFRIYDPDGYEVEYFAPDGTHHRYADTAPTAFVASR